MKTRVFSIFDAKAAVFGVPFFVHNDAMAVRLFSDLVNDPKSMVARHPEDYSLYFVGTFEDDTALITGEVTPTSLMTASNMRKPIGKVVEEAKV